MKVAVLLAGDEVAHDASAVYRYRGAFSRWYNDASAVCRWKGACSRWSGVKKVF